MKSCKLDIGDSIFMACGKVNEVEKILSLQEIKLQRIKFNKSKSIAFVGLLIILCSRY